MFQLKIESHILKKKKKDAFRDTFIQGEKGILGEISKRDGESIREAPQYSLYRLQELQKGRLMCKTVREHRKKASVKNSKSREENRYMRNESPLSCTLCWH